MENKNCTIIVSSFDGYSDAWEPFFTLFFRYWPDYPYDIYLISNELEYPDKRIKSIKINPDLGWSGNMIRALKKINTEYILYFQEDFFIQKKVNTERIKKLIGKIKEYNGVYLRIDNKKAETFEINDELICEIDKKANYINALQLAIWNRESFLSLMDKDESGWDFELRGGLEKARKIDEKFLSVKTPAINYFATAIVKGYYLKGAVNLCKKEGVKLDFKKRKIEPFYRQFLRKYKILNKLYKIIRNA